MRLSELIAASTGLGMRELNTNDGTDDPTITDVVSDSRDARQGALFCCVRGSSSDGHDFAEAAIAAGAAALLVDHVVPLAQRVPQLVVADTRLAMAHVAVALHHDPSAQLQVIGITGTNGKTTTAHILSCALDALDRPTGVIGTLSGAHTTPESPELQRRLAGFLAVGKTAVAMEVSSHALVLDRVVGTRFRAAVFTNLGRDHLDLHGTQERYFAAKALLFRRELSDHAVVNVDDVHGRLLADTIDIPCTAYSFDELADVEVGAFDHSYTWRGQRVRVGLGGRFNVMNSLAAATALSVLGHEPAHIARALATTTPVRGRFEPVIAGQPFTVVVDYAHTPDAMIEALTAARSVSDAASIIVVFGCGGDRDPTKRPEMGLAAVEHADLVVVTSDNPRSEDPLAIINDVIAGVPANYRERIVVEPDRHEAIALALRSAAPSDVVLIAGKGHETTQTFHDTVTEFDDRAVARELLGAAS